MTALDRGLAYYQDLVKSVQGMGSRAIGSAELIALLSSRRQAASSATAKGTGQLVDPYNELSAKNLDPVARLHAIASPFTRHTETSISFRSVALSF